MKHFRVLLVDDDEPEILSKAVAEFPEGGRVRLRTAKDKATAEKLLKKEFFHLALIDPRLHPKDDNKFDGVNLLRKLKELRPSCERLILTHLGRRGKDDAKPIARQLHPIDGLAQGILMKTDVARAFRKLINEKANRWLNNPEGKPGEDRPLDIVGTDLAAQTLHSLFNRRDKKSSHKTKTAITADEIDFLVSRLFGQGEPWDHKHEGLGIQRVELTLIRRQGFSPAAVFKARSFSSNNTEGIMCVLKFAKRDYVEQELVRYSRYVRFRLAMHHRAELLGWGFADNVGVLCYNFAGDTSLSKLFLKKDAGFFRALDDLFSPKKQSWYTDPCVVRLSDHFLRDYKMDVLKVTELIRQVLAELERQFQGSRRGHQVALCGATLNLPDDVLQKSVFDQEMPGCIVHGDLHCDNVIVGKDDQPMLIDYFSVTNGPRALDFATQEGSVRLLALQRLDEHEDIVPDPRPDTEVIPEQCQALAAEEAVWKAVWGRNTAESAAAPGEPSWSTASIQIGKLAQANFPKKEDPARTDLTEEEYAATCLLWALRLFKVEDMPLRDLARLLVWISFLVQVLMKR